MYVCRMMSQANDNIREGELYNGVRLSEIVQKSFLRSGDHNYPVCNAQEAALTPGHLRACKNTHALNYIRRPLNIGQ